MSGGKDPDPAHERHSRTADNPPVDERKPPRRTIPGSHTTGGAKDHARPDEDEGPRRP